MQIRPSAGTTEENKSNKCWYETILDLSLKRLLSIFRSLVQLVLKCWSVNSVIAEPRLINGLTS
jgi:hypothetical protein